MNNILMFHRRQYAALTTMLILVMSVNLTTGNHNPQKNQQQGIPTAAVAGTVAATATNGEVFAAKSFPLLPEEPSCEQLRAMWIFSKRQSRAAELTNEIPTFRDPFAYNVWNPYYATAALAGAGGSRTGLDGLQMITARHQSNTRSPVFGRVVSQEPVFPSNFASKTIGVDNGHSKSLMQYPKISSSTNLDSGKRPLLTSQMRYVGSSPSNSGSGSNNNNNALAVQGSFHKLKELIWTERAKELTQQRRLEELAARAAVLKEIANGQNIQSPYKQQPLQQQQHHSDSMLMDENRSPEVDFNADADNVRQRFRQGNKSQQSQQQQQQKQQQQQEQHEQETIESKNHQEQLQKTPLRGANRSYVSTKNRVGTNRQKLYHRGYGGGRDLYQRPIAVVPYMHRPTSYDIDSDDKTYENLREESDFSAIDGENYGEEAEEAIGSKPRWRNSAGGIVRKYTKPKAGGSHFRERQRALLKQYPLDKYYRRMTRGSRLMNYEINSDNDNHINNNNQFLLLNNILQKLRENYNGFNNNYDNEQKYVYNLNKPGDYEPEEGIEEEEIIANNDYEEEN